LSYARAVRSLSASVFGGIAQLSLQGEPVDVNLADGAVLRAELFAPDSAGPCPGVLVLHESFGLNDDIRRIARRFADAGYVALTPDLYSHGRRIVCLSRVMIHLLRGSIDREIADILSARETLARRDEVDAGRIAVAGFCQGGGFALIAGTKPGFRAAAVNYGEVPKDRIRLDGVCPIVASYGAKDRIWGRNTAERLERHLEALGVPHDVKTYDGVGHSFFSQVDGWQGWLARVPTPLAQGYDEAAANDSWRRMLAFFDEHVRSASGTAPRANNG
jgi:carboxymethylenebutenolidase